MSTTDLSTVERTNRRGFASSLAMRAGVVWCVVALCSSFALAQEQAAPLSEAEDANVATRLVAICKADLAQYEFLVDGSPIDADHGLHVSPLMNWANPVRDGTQHGYLALWTYDGRPIAIGTAFSFPSPVAGKAGYMFVHEFHTLTLRSIEASRDGKTLWNPKNKAYTPKRFAEAPAPAESPVARMRQMRELAERFSAKGIDGKNVVYPMRLLHKPLYRFEKSERDESLDGALFAMVCDSGTDPEILLRIECDKTGPAGQWSYGVFRYSDRNLFVELDGKQIWTFEKGGVWPIQDCGLRDIYRLFEDRIVEVDFDAPATNPKASKTIPETQNQSQKPARRPKPKAED